ncbi:MAG: PBP superfamily domain protein [Syntrophorhabdus sp. PtaU1.Bin050]|nr:MAG: PBP superfamily domain protein [Syntrophorhabdus sp. PtaU1.Bin050]
MEILSAKDLSKYLKINEKKIYKLVQESKIPHIKIGGKIAFTKEIIDRWILENTEREKQIYIAGSDDILLSRIINFYNSRSQNTAFYAPVGSINGLRLLKDRAATMSCVHIFDTDKKEHNLSYLDRYLPKDSFVVRRLFSREQGIYLPKGNPKGIRGFEDVIVKGVKFINRNQGSGTRILIDFLIQEKGIDPLKINGYTMEVESHLQAGLKVLRGEAEAAFGIRYVAHMLDLAFVPQLMERFDMVIPTEHYHTNHVQTFLTFFEQPALLNHIQDFTGYDTTEMGSTTYHNHV